jgi:hypothetical protein
MVAEFGSRYAIVGHSERRTVFGDTDAVVVAKFAAARRAKLTPIFCVGETLEEREAGRTEAVLARQVDALLDAGAAQLDGAIVAYEPVWAIGTGRTATSAQAQEAHVFLRARVADRDKAVAAELAILYGGSVKGLQRRGVVRDAGRRRRIGRRGVAGGRKNSWRSGVLPGHGRKRGIAIADVDHGFHILARARHRRARLCSMARARHGARLRSGSAA